MRYVDHDPAAARAAAAACRGTAADHLAVARWLDTAPATVAWWGAGRAQVVDRCRGLAVELRTEAARLLQDAEGLETAAWVAERLDRERARSCVPTGAASDPTSSWGHAS